MNNQYDIAVIGGGHNGLTCACYLAKSGLKVIVLERRHIVGGAVFIFFDFMKSNCTNEFSKDIIGF